ncbi:MAG: ABC transporter substrate-binding protein, partial [Clostridia bacterium]
MTRSTAATRYRGIIGNRTNSFTYRTLQLECILFNLGVGTLKNIDVRRAITHAIDKSRLITAVYQDVAIATDTIAMPGSFLYNDNTQVYHYNLQLSNQLLDQAGWHHHSPRRLHSA